MPRLPTGPFSLHRTGCYGCVRKSPSDGSCGVHGYPCVHRGMDLFAEQRDVFAPEAGVVEKVADGSNPPFVGYGPGVVLLRGASGFYHLLSHLDFKTITVKPGQPILEGILLGQFNAEHGHTHYEVRKAPTGPSETNTVDPMQWLASEQRKLVASVAPPSSRGRTVAIGAVTVVGFLGLSWLALRIAKNAAMTV